MLYHAKIGGRTIISIMMHQGKVILVFQHTEFFFFHFCDEIVAKNCTTQQVNTTSEQRLDETNTLYYNRENIYSIYNRYVR